MTDSLEVVAAGTSRATERTADLGWCLVGKERDGLEKKDWD